MRMQHDKHAPQGTKPASEAQQWATKLVDEVGCVRAAKRIGVSRTCLAAFCAGWTCYPATHAAVRDAMETDA